MTKRSYRRTARCPMSGIDTYNNIFSLPRSFVKDSITITYCRMVRIFPCCIHINVFQILIYRNSGIWFFLSYIWILGLLLPCICFNLFCILFKIAFCLLCAFCFCCLLSRLTACIRIPDSASSHILTRFFNVRFIQFR